MSLVLDEHRQYLSDRYRVSAFDRAIKEVVKPGDVVLDLGCGTGILGMLACRAGAGRVYSIDDGELIQMARDLSRANGFVDRTVFINRHSTRADLPEKVDVVVADQIGRFGFEAGLPHLYNDARKRFLKPAGRVIPCAVDLEVCPVNCPELWVRTEFWRTSPAGFDFSPARSVAINTGYPVKLIPGQLLGSPSKLGTIDPTRICPESFTFETRAVIERPGLLHGIGGWFSARLTPGVRMTNSPLSAERIDRRNVFLPIDRPVEVSRGSEIAIRMHIMPQGGLLSWTVEILSGENLCFSHSTLKGMLLSREGLLRTCPDSVPRIDRWGEARLSILQLCDGRALRDIESEVFRRHSSLFRSPAEASAFVAEVVTRYAV